MVTISVTIGTARGATLLVASSERDAAIMTENAIFAMSPQTLPVPLWVQCRDDRVRDRLMGYLAGVQRDLALPRPAPERI